MLGLILKILAESKYIGRFPSLKSSSLRANGEGTQRVKLHFYANKPALAILFHLCTIYNMKKPYMIKKLIFHGGKNSANSIGI